MPQVVYVGPSLDGVEIAETGQHAPQGVAVDVEENVAKRLLQQDIFEAADAAKASRKRGAEKEEG